MVDISEIFVFSLVHLDGGRSCVEFLLRPNIELIMGYSNRSTYVGFIQATLDFWNTLLHLMKLSGLFCHFLPKYLTSITRYDDQRTTNFLLRSNVSPC